MVNGLAAFEALYFTRVESTVNRILHGNQGPLGTPGIAAIVVSEGIFGKGKTEENFMGISFQLINFTSELSKAV